MCFVSSVVLHWTDVRGVSYAVEKKVFLYKRSVFWLKSTWCVSTGLTDTVLCVSAVTVLPWDVMTVFVCFYIMLSFTVSFYMMYKSMMKPSFYIAACDITECLSGWKSHIIKLKCILCHFITWTIHLQTQLSSLPLIFLLY